MNPNHKIESDKLADGLAKKIVEEIEKRANEMTKQKNEELKKVRKEKNEELKKVRKELKQIITDKDKMLKKVIKEKKEELEKVINDNDKMLEEERCELEQLGDINSALIIKERQSTYELQEAHTELIRGFRDLSGEGSVIGVKRMGEVDGKPFLKVCEQRFNGENVGLQHAMLCSEWQKNINDSAWYPFKLVVTGEKMKEVVDDEDDKLKKLSEELGEDVMNAVKTALEELNDFNPSGRYSVPALWNFVHGRKATLSEGIAHMTQQIKNFKRQRT
ncbi:factor of DNA methylation 5-like [Brassica napus]|uniref:factor of DNA methylation 5-like n=1 Tax=Brassica napus TaxID=3708 RepID=UPI002078CA3F|nr:factor of DNA methylation 5-like [Brassica napus]